MTHSRAFKLTTVFVIACFVAQATHGASDLAELRDRLRESKEETYIAVRDEVLALDTDRFADLLEMLRLETNDWLDHWLANVLEARRRFPELARRFDEEHAYMLAHPLPGRTIKGGVVYRSVWLPPDSNDVNILIFEHVFKIDTPRGPRRGYLMLLFNPERATRKAIGPLLELLDAEDWLQVGSAAAMALARTAVIHADARVAPAFLDLYERTRVEEIEAYSPETDRSFSRSRGVAAAIKYMASEEGLACVSSMIAIEIELATKHGFAPWENDIESVGGVFLEASRRHSRTSAEMDSGKRRRNEQELSGLKAIRDAAHERYTWQEQWYTLHQAKARIEAALAEREEKPQPPPAPKAMRSRPPGG